MRRFMVGLAIAVAACAPVATPDGYWQLTGGTLDGRAISMVSGHAVSLTVRGPMFDGTGPCNRYGGEITLGAGTFRITQLGSTAMACSDPGVMAAEDDYFGALRRVVAEQAATDRLVLTGDGTELRFVRVAPPSTPAS